MQPRSTSPPRCKRPSPADKLKTIWESVLDRYGPFQKIVGSRTETRGPYEIVYVTCQFEKDKLDVRLVYSKEKKLGGLQFVPPKPAVEYKSPAYVHAEQVQGRARSSSARTRRFRCPAR